MNCDVARDLLPEHALGVAGVKGRAVGEHLAWCAACRKESRDLQRASAGLAFALAPVEPPPDLVDSVAAQVRRAAGVAAGTPRRPRRALTILLAAALGVAGLGGGAVLARRDPGTTAELQAQHREDGLDAFRRFVDATRVVDGDTEASLAVLLAAGGGEGGGSAMAIVAPTIRDRAIVVASDLREDPRALPYTAWLANGSGKFLRIGVAEQLTTNGGFTLARIVSRDLSGYVNVLVRDARGRIVLSGTLTSDTSIPTPAP